VIGGRQAIERRLTEQRLGREPEDAHRAVDERHPQVGVEREHHVVEAVDQGAVAGLAVAQRALGGVLRRDVLDRRQRPGQRAVGVADQRERHVDPDRVPVLVPVAALAAVDREQAGPELAHRGLDAGAVVGVRQVIAHRQRAQLRGAVAGDRAQLRVHPGQPAGDEVALGDADRRQREHRRQPLLAGLHCLDRGPALGDVLDHREQADRPVRFVEAGQGQAAPQRPPAAVAVALLVGQRAHLACVQRGQERLIEREVFGRRHVAPGHAEQHLARVPEGRAHRVVGRQEAPAVRVDQRHPDPGLLEDGAEPRLAVVERLRHLRPLGEDLAEQHQPADRTAGVVPRPHLPAHPVGVAVAADERLAGVALDRAGQAALVDLAPARRQLGEHVVVAAPAQRLIGELVVGDEPPADLEVPQLAIEQGDRGGRVLDEQPQARLARRHRGLGALGRADVLGDRHEARWHVAVPDERDRDPLPDARAVLADELLFDHRLGATALAHLAVQRGVGRRVLGRGHVVVAARLQLGLGVPEQLAHPPVGAHELAARPHQGDADRGVFVQGPEAAIVGVAGGRLRAPGAQAKGDHVPHLGQRQGDLGRGGRGSHDHLQRVGRQRDWAEPAGFQVAHRLCRERGGARFVRRQQRPAQRGQLDQQSRVVADIHVARECKPGATRGGACGGRNGENPRAWPRGWCRNCTPALRSQAELAHERGVVPEQVLLAHRAVGVPVADRGHRQLERLARRRD
jgi:hypothetical protein